MVCASSTASWEESTVLQNLVDRAAVEAEAEALGRRGNRVTVRFVRLLGLVPQLRPGAARCREWHRQPGGSAEVPLKIFRSKDVQHLQNHSHFPFPIKNFSIQF